MVDQERVDRLLARVAEDLRELAGYRKRGAELLDDRTELAAAKYYFITAIEGCARVAQHLIAAEGWLVAETTRMRCGGWAARVYWTCRRPSLWRPRSASATFW